MGFNCIKSIPYAGNNMYSFIRSRNSVQKSYLLLTDVLELVSVFDGIYCEQYGTLLPVTYLLETPLYHIIL